jgi:hypothetical protein
MLENFQKWRKRRRREGKDREGEKKYESDGVQVEDTGNRAEVNGCTMVEDQVVRFQSV